MKPGTLLVLTPDQQPGTRLMRRVLVALAWLVAVGATVWLLVLAGGVAGQMLTGSRWLVAFGAVAFDVIAYVSVGAILTIRRPGNRIGLVLIAGSLLIVTTFLGFVLGATLTSARGPDDPAAQWASLVGGLTIYPAIILAGPALALLVPDGRLPGPRWRWAVATLVAMYVVGVALFLGKPGLQGDSLANNPLGNVGLPWNEALSPVGEGLAAATLPLSLVLAVAAVVVRFRRSRGVERQQLKWFVAANLAFATCMLLSFADGATEPTLFDVAAFVSLSFPAIAIGIAVLRYRLYEIDRLISRTIGWAIVTGILVAVFVGLVVALQTVLAPVTSENTLAVAASTLVAFALFQPLRRRVQRAVDRRFDRARYDGQRTVDAFAERLRNEVDLGTLRTSLSATANEAVRPVSAAVWLRVGTGERP
jgi:MFS family permease